MSTNALLVSTPESMTDEQLSTAIVRWQAIQQWQPNTHTANWQTASRHLSTLFAEAAKRAANGSVIRSL